MTNKKQRILLIGASGMIGSAVHKLLSQRHTIITAGTNSGDLHIDVTDPTSIKQAFEQSEPFDAVIATLGKATFAPLAELTAAPLESSPHRLSIENKLLGQVNLATIAATYLTDNGSITLTSGILNKHPIEGSISPGMVNSALETFVASTADELPRGIRINIVSPGIVRESHEHSGMFPGYDMIDAADVALGYSRSVDSRITGQVIKRW